MVSEKKKLGMGEEKEKIIESENRERGKREKGERERDK